MAANPYSLYMYSAGSECAVKSRLSTRQPAQGVGLFGLERFACNLPDRRMQHIAARGRPDD